MREYDPGGPAGGYLPSMTTSVRCSTWTALAASHLQYVIESSQLGTGDSLKITDDFGVVVF